MRNVAVTTPLIRKRSGEFLNYGGLWGPDDGVVQRAIPRKSIGERGARQTHLSVRFARLMLAFQRPQHMKTVRKSVAAIR